MEDRKFIMIFWFCVGIGASGLVFLAALIFMPYPLQHEQMANMALGFITGTLITGAIQYLTGGTPAVKKPDNLPVNKTDSGDIINK